jgi:hypothetical protein
LEFLNFGPEPVRGAKVAGSGHNESWVSAFEPTTNPKAAHPGAAAFRQVLLFHQHRGEPSISIFVCTNIVENLETDIFSARVFNNIQVIFRFLIPFCSDPSGRRKGK